jgi:hypothetical protein
LRGGAGGSESAPRERAFTRSARPGAFTATRAGGFCSSARRDLEPARARWSRARAPRARARAELRRDAEPRERRVGAREIVGVIDADRERAQRAARTRLDPQLLAAVGAGEATGCGLGEAEVAVERANRVVCAGADRDRGERCRDIGSLREQGARVGAVDRRVGGSVERAEAVELCGEIRDDRSWRERPVAAVEDMTGLREREQARQRRGVLERAVSK